jgi:hypothetical protein
MRLAQRVREANHRLLEAVDRRADGARSDLTNAGLAMRDAGVDDRLDAGGHD